MTVTFQGNPTHGLITVWNLVVFGYFRKLFMVIYQLWMDKCSSFQDVQFRWEFQGVFNSVALSDMLKLHAWCLMKV